MRPKFRFIFGKIGSGKTQALESEDILKKSEIFTPSEFTRGAINQALKEGKNIILDGFSFEDLPSILPPLLTFSFKHPLREFTITIDTSNINLDIIGCKKKIGLRRSHFFRNGIFGI